jgi:hypothetical protein
MKEASLNMNFNHKRTTAPSFLLSSPHCHPLSVHKPHVKSAPHLDSPLLLYNTLQQVHRDQKEAIQTQF